MTTELAPVPASPAPTPAPVQEGTPTAPVQEAAPPPPADRPEWLPEGFDGPEALVAAHAAASEELTALKAAPGIDLEPVYQEYAETGDVSAERRAVLEKAGISGAVIDHYIAGHKAVVESNDAELYAIVGGQEKYTEMITWAAAGGMTAEEREGYNSGIAGGRETAKLVIDAAQQKWLAATGSQGQPLEGTTTVRGGETFQSLEEHHTAVADPRYKNDPAYRASVSKRLASSGLV